MQNENFIVFFKCTTIHTSGTNLNVLAATGGANTLLAIPVTYLLQDLVNNA